MPTRSKSPPVPASLLTVDQAAGWLSVSKYTMRDWRNVGTGRRWLRLGQLIRYDPADVRDWLDQQAQAPTGATG